MSANHREMNDGIQPLQGPLKGDAGSGEIVFGVMFLGLALTEYLARRWEIDYLLLMAAVLIPAWGLAYWSSRIIQRRVLQPRIGCAVPHVPATAQAPTGSETSRWTLIKLLALIGVAAACLGWLLGGVSHPENERSSLTISILGIGLWPVSQCGAYAFWIVFNGQEKQAWKWVVMALMALGFLMLGLPVRGNYFAVFPETALLNGIVWLGSGLATLCLYVRNAGPPDVPLT